LHQGADLTRNQNALAGRQITAMIESHQNHDLHPASTELASNVLLFEREPKYLF
jgi:hypothetical protein